MCKDKSPASKPSWAQVVASSTSPPPIQTSGQQPSSTAQPPSSSPPPPKLTPVPVKKPGPVTTSKPVAPCTNPQARGWPLGFESEQQFVECMDELEQACKDSGIALKGSAVRGSVATYTSRNPHKKGQHFDS